MPRLSSTLCTRAASQISLRLDGELSPFEEAELRAHLDDCPSCRAYEQQTTAFTALVRATPPEPFETRIVMPRRYRLAARPVQVAAAAAVLMVVGLGGALGIGRGGSGFSTTDAARTSVQASSARPAYMDSAWYELRIIRHISDTHPPRGGSAVPL